MLSISCDDFKKEMDVVDARAPDSTPTLLHLTNHVSHFFHVPASLLSPSLSPCPVSLATVPCSTDYIQTSGADIHNWCSRRMGLGSFRLYILRRDASAMLRRR